MTLVPLTKDLKNAAATLKDTEVRFLVDAYYQMQNDRIRSDNRSRSLSETGEPHEILQWLGLQSYALENDIKSVLKTYMKTHPMGKWLNDIDGIGPVISAGLVAYIDINVATTAGKIWSFAGIDVGKIDKEWKKGEKRPWCAGFKTLCWKIGESFVKVSGKDTAFYGKYYVEWKETYNKRNENGEMAALAARYLETYKFSKSTEAYKAYITGKLPKGHIHAMAKRKAVRLFLAHLQQVWYEKHHGVAAPKPFIIEHGGHVDYIAPPNYERI